MKVHVEEIVIGQSEMAEQVVSLAGPVTGLQVAIPMLLNTLSECVSQPWFKGWAFNCMASNVSKGQARVDKGKAGGSGWDVAPTSSGGPGGKGDWWHTTNLEIMDTALHCIPEQLADPMDTSWPA